MKIASDTPNERSIRHNGGNAKSGPGGATNAVIPGLGPTEQDPPPMMPDAWAVDAQAYFSDRVTIAENGCWVTPIKLDPDGYARSFFRRQRYYLHRLAYEAFNGPIPNGLQIDHLCRNRACCNPEHLEPVTSWENTSRSTNPMALKARQTHCKRGHEFTDANTRRRGRARECKACKRMLASPSKWAF